MKKIYLFTLVSVLSIFQNIYCQVTLQTYLPPNLKYDPAIPTPKSVLGYEVGEWHISHGQLVYYMRTLARASDRITLEEYAFSHEKRPLLVLVITSPQNHQQIDKIKQAHQDLCNPKKSTKLNTKEMPLVVNLGYGVHGNEASGSNAAVLVAYYLAAAQGREIQEMLKNTVILVDPSLNPDGLQRFSTWVNQYKSKTLVTDPHSREFHEDFPRSRTNHYWFDLNRDWLLVQHPESRGRIAKFQEWKPNILTDHHEMGSNSTFFFQPGVPSRTNALTPPQNQQLTEEIGQFHAAALDQAGRMYFTKEAFDDFYYGKGSTYPDINGGIGILFEQASARGHAQKTKNGILTFPFAIQNHFIVSLSTLKAAQNMREKLLNYQQEFYKKAIQGKGGYVFGSAKDPARNYHFLEILHHHHIEVYPLSKDMEIDQQEFQKEQAYIVPLSQPQSCLIKALFEKQTNFQDSIFYDVSTWTLPLAFNMPYAKINSLPKTDKLATLKFPEGKITENKTGVAYIFHWDNYYAPRALYQLQQKGVQVKVATKPATLKTTQKTIEINYGTILIPANQEMDMPPETLQKLLQKIARENGITLYSLPTGLAEEGSDLGSVFFKNLVSPKVLMLIGNGVQSYNAGEVWHLLDQRYHMPVSMITPDKLDQLDLQAYNVVVFPEGSYSLKARVLNDLKRWLQKGNTLIGLGSANRWLNNQGLINLNFVPSSLTEEDTNDTNDTNEIIPYASKEKIRGAQQIGGAIFEAFLDITHPLGYGFHQTKIPVFKNNRLFVQREKALFRAPLFYREQPLLSGYISGQNLEKLKNTSSIIVHHFGQGKLISMIDNPNFRGFWYGTNKLFANALFFGQIIER